MIDRLVFRLPAAVILLSSIAFIQQCAAHAPAKIMLVSAGQLREFGIDIAKPSSFPNKCYWPISLSDALVERFKLKGFTLQTLCLAIESPWVAYHPETGQALKIAALGEQGPSFLLNPPDCFKHGAPFLDCSVTYYMDAGIRDPEAAETRQRAQLVDAAVRRLIAAGQFRRDCQCEDLEFNDTLKEVTIKKGASCHADTIPACPDPKSAPNWAVCCLRLTVSILTACLRKVLPTTGCSTSLPIFFMAMLTWLGLQRETLIRSMYRFPQAKNFNTK